MKALFVIMIVSMLSSCTVNMNKLNNRQAPKEMDHSQIDAYIKSGHGRYCSEYTAILSVGKDSVIYQTYLVDKSWWLFVDKK